MALLGKGANKSVRSSNYIGGIPRTKCPRNFKFRTTFSSGKLIPLFCDEFIPAETKSVNIGELVRSITPLGPTMDNSFLDIFCFFVPRRLVWDHWEEFIAGYNKEAWAQDHVYTIPRLKFTAKTKAEAAAMSENAYLHSFLDYMPGAVDVVALASMWKKYGTDLSADAYAEAFGSQDKVDELLKFIHIDACYPRAFFKIWNDWFRDENLCDEYELYTGDGDEYAEDFCNISLLDPKDLPNVAKYHNRFTTALPSPVKGPDVLIPAAPFAWLSTAPDGELRKFNSTGLAPTLGTSNGQPEISAAALGFSEEGLLSYLYEEAFSDASNDGYIGSSDIGISLQKAMGTIRQLRLATQTELLLARDARGGTRYVESLLSHFGVHNGDARLQRSEYLGSRQIPLNITQITNTSQAGDNALGNVGGQSLTKDNAHYFTYSATEHGILWIVACVRPNLSYSSGVRKIYQRWTRFDHIWPEFRHIGDVPLYQKELETAAGLYDILDGGLNYDDMVFGYTPYGSELREGYNFNNGLFRDKAIGSLSYLTYQEEYVQDESPVLDAEWIAQSDVPIGRTLIDQKGPQFYALFDIYMEDTIPLDPTSDPGLMDHF